MHPILWSTLCTSALTLGALSTGCGEQFSPDYHGDSLLSVRGSVKIANDTPGGELIPALGFHAGGESRVTIVEVPVRGTFPADFQFEVYEPPPDAVRFYLQLRPSSEPRVAIGYITAVAKDHPDVIYGANEVSTTVYGCVDKGRADHLCLITHKEYCVSFATDVPCYTEDLYCPNDHSPPDQCVTETTGDPTLAAENIWEYSAGFSQNYQVIYLEDAAPAGSATASWFGAPDGIVAGYGLYEVRPLSEEELAANAECFEGGYMRAAELYNAAHGTHYTTVRCPAEGSDIPFCPDAYDDITGRLDAWLEVRYLLEAAALEHGCSLGFLQYKRVSDPANASISVVIDSDIPFAH